MPTYTKPSDTANKIQLESHLIYAIWTVGLAHAGQEAQLEVRTSLVGNGAKIKITSSTENGKKLDKVEGTVFNNRYTGKVLIPDNCKPDDMIYFEAELPKHGLKEQSNSIPVRPVIKVSKMQWDRSEVKRGDIVTLTCQFQSGVQDDDDATVIIYEHNPNSNDIKVVSIPTVIKDNKIEIQWEFDYQDNTILIPTDDDLQPYKKNYYNPDFYFVVVVDDVAIGEKMESGLMKFKDEKEFQIVDELGNILANTAVVYLLSDGSRHDAATDANGYLQLKNIPPGAITIEMQGYDLILKKEI